MGANRRSARRQRRGLLYARLRRNSRRLAGVCALLLATGMAGAFAAHGLRRVSSHLRASKSLQVSGIDVTGNRVLGREEIVRAAGLQTGVNLLEINPSRIRELLRKLPAVERVSVRRILPGRLSVRVVERVPVALVNLGRVQQVDAEGVLFDLGRGSLAGLPVVTGLRDTVDAATGHRLTPVSQQRLTAFREALARSDTDWMEHISQVEFADHGMIRLILEGYEAVIEMDDAEVTVRMNQLRRLLEVLADEEGGIVRRISLGRNNVAYVRRGR